MKFNLTIQKDKTYTQLGFLLRYYRLRDGLSLRDLGRLANVSHTLIANIEKGSIVGNTKTITDLFRILKVDYREDNDLVERFTTLYQQIFLDLYMYRYGRATKSMKELLVDEDAYSASIVITDFVLLRLLYENITGHITYYTESNINILRDVTSLLSDNQLQLFYFIDGLIYFNTGHYYNGHVRFQKALKIGDQNLDALINLYVVRCQVKMYRFMDAQSSAEETIAKFEMDMAYPRVAELRLELAYSHMLVRKHKDSNAYLEMARTFGIEFGYDEFVNTSYEIESFFYFYTEHFNTIQTIIDQVSKDTVRTLYIKLYVAMNTGNIDSAKGLYDHIESSISETRNPRERLFYTLVGVLYQLRESSEEKLVKILTDLEHICLAAHDMEYLFFVYDVLINYYKSKRMYKQAFTYSEKAREIRSYGILNEGKDRKNIK